jgi:hypothetical protein
LGSSCQNNGNMVVFYLCKKSSGKILASILLDKDGVIGDIVDTVKILCAFFLQNNAHGSCPAKIRWNRF